MRSKWRAVLVLVLAFAAGPARADEARPSLEWPVSGDDVARLDLDTSPDRPLIARLTIRSRNGGDAVTLLQDVEPTWYLTVGSRQEPGGRPPDMSPFNVFFDTPAKRPHRDYLVRRGAADQGTTNQARPSATRQTVRLAKLSAGPFEGWLEITVYHGSPLIQCEAVLSTEQDRIAYLYDAGLVAAGKGKPGWRRFGWVDAEGNLTRQDADPAALDRPVAVRHRAIAAEWAEGGSVACFPPPHQFFFPRDLTENVRTTWIGRGHRGLTDAPGFGIRQAERGGGSFVPWFNAPPGTEQRLGVFYLASRGGLESALNEARKLTHDDRFPNLPGHLTFTSHWHMAVAMAALEKKAKGQDPGMPDFVRMFKDMGVNLVHLAEFHGDGHPQDPGPLRLAEMDAMVAECRRLSDDKLLLIPGEEANVYFGKAEPGKHPGHWLYLFPRPVSWTMKRQGGQPFVEDDPARGKVYHVGSVDDLTRLIEAEHGLVWTAHPRIKASSWAPDRYRDEPYFKADFWLGGAWKAMPADLSRPRLGDRVLDLFSDMDNWGRKKLVLGEVDVFKLDHTHELYGHMNVNYVKLDRVPRFDEGWQPLLDALRGARFFVTTGEVLVEDFTLGGQPSGGTLTLGQNERPELKATLVWTFPMRFAELVSGDGHRVYRDRIDLSDTGPFGRKELTLRPDLAGRTWARLEAWDVATNGAFTQPVWIDNGLSRSGR